MDIPRKRAWFVCPSFFCLRKQTYLSYDFNFISAIERSWKEVCL